MTLAAQTVIGRLFASADDAPKPNAIAARPGRASVPGSDGSRHPETDALVRALPQVEAALSGTAPPRRPPPHQRRHPHR
jgi:hypothetical protein